MPLRVAPLSRGLLIALLLNLFMPGLGLIYCGRNARGLMIWFGVLLALLLLLWIWSQSLFLLTWPLKILLLAWGSLQLMLFEDVCREFQKQGREDRLRPINHPLTYLALFLGLALFPLSISFYLLSLSLSFVQVRDTAMFPQFLPGDHILMELRAEVDPPPREGDLVVISWP